MQREQGQAPGWLLTAEEQAFVTEKATRSWLGFALQLKFYQHTGRFLERLSDLSEGAADGHRQFDDRADGELHRIVESRGYAAALAPVISSQIAKAWVRTVRYSVAVT